MGFEHLLGCWLGDHSYCVYPWLRICLSTNKVSSFCIAKELRKGWTVVWCKNNEKPMNSGNWKAETCHSQRLFTSAESIITSLCVHFFCFVFSRKTRKLISQIMFLELKEMSWAMNQVWILSKQSNLSTLRRRAYLQNFSALLKPIVKSMNKERFRTGNSGSAGDTLN